MTREEAVKFLNDTKVYVNGKSKEIQKILFSLGFKWCDNSQKINKVNCPFLFLHNGWIAYGNNMTFFTKCSYREITPEDILNITIDESAYRPFKDLIGIHIDQNYRPFKNDDEYFELILRDEGKKGDIYDKNNGQKYVMEIFFTDKEYVRMRVSTAMDFDYIKEKFILANGQPINVLTDIPGKDLIEKSTGKSYKVEYTWTLCNRSYITSIFTLPEAFDRFIFKDNSPFGVLQD